MITPNTPEPLAIPTTPNGWTHVETSTPTEDRFVVATSKLARRGHDLLDDLETIKTAFAELTTENATLRSQRDDALRMLHELQHAHDLELARAHRLYNHALDQKQRQLDQMKSQLDTTTYLAEELRTALHETRATQTTGERALPIIGNHPRLETCPGCNGVGTQEISDKQGYCMVCRGAGNWIRPEPKDACQTCDGTGREDINATTGNYIRCTKCGGRGRW